MRDFSSASRRLRTVFTASLLALALAVGAAAQPSSSGTLTPAGARPPWQRLLTGADAQQVQELENAIAALVQGRKHAEAREPARKVVEIRSRVQGDDHWQTANARWLLRSLEGRAALSSEAAAELAAAVPTWQAAFALVEQGRYAEALPLLEKAVEAPRRHLGVGNRNVVIALDRLGWLRQKLCRFKEAGLLYEELLKTFQEAVGEESPSTAVAREGLAQCLLGLGRYVEAAREFNTALDVFRRTVGEGDPLTARCLSHLATNLSAVGQYADAERCFRQALTALQSTLGEHHLVVAECRGDLAACLFAQGRLTEAEPLALQGFATSAFLVGDDHPEALEGRNTLAAILYEQAQYPAAEGLQRTILKYCLRAYGEKHPTTATACDNLALTLTGLDKYREGEELHRKALALYWELLGETHPATVSCTECLAYNLEQQGKYPESERLLREALAINCRRCLRKICDVSGAPSAEQFALAQSCSYLGRNLHAQGKYLEAEPYLLKAKDMWARVAGTDERRTLPSAKIVARNYWVQGRYREAEVVLTEAADVFERGRRRGAGRALDRASPAEVFTPLPWLAVCLARRGAAGAAWQRLEQGLARSLDDELSLQRIRPTDEARQRVRDLNDKLKDITKWLSARKPASAATDPKRAAAAESQWQRARLEAELLRLRAESALEVSAAAAEPYGLPRIQAQLPEDSALLAWIDFPALPGAADPDGEHWACLVRRTGPPAWVRLPGSGRAGAWTVDDDRLPERLQRALLREPGAESEDWQALARQLYLQRLAPLAGHLGAGANGPAVKHLIVLPAQGRWSLQTIPVEVLTDAYVVSYAHSGTVFARLREQGYAGRGATTGGVPWRLFALGDPPFQAQEPALPDHGVLVAAVAPSLKNAAGEGLQVGDVLLSYAGTRLSGPADLAAALRAKAPPPDQRHPGAAGVPAQVWRGGQTMDMTVTPGLLGVQFSPSPPAEVVGRLRQAARAVRGPAGQSFGALPGTRREVKAIAEVFERAQQRRERSLPPAADREPPATVLLGTEASKQRLETLAAAGLDRYRVLHLATHGVVNDACPMQSALILAQDRAPDDLSPASVRERGRDGFLTAEDILQTWKLDADLVTLSACQTGLGQAHGGESFMGFSQALFLAGARSLLLSLWEVDDRATALLMWRFYQNLLGERPGLARPLSKVAALHEAKRWLRQLTTEEVERHLAAFPGTVRGDVRDRGEVAVPVTIHPYEHPYYWSAFILIGEPGEQMPNEDATAGGEARAASVGGPIPTLLCLLLALIGLAVVQVVRARAGRLA